MSWGEDLSKALPDPAADDNNQGEQGGDTNAKKPKETPQEHGWAQPVGIDYGRYLDQQSAPARGNGDAPAGGEAPDNAVGHTIGEWASEAVKYEWKDEYGDVGPAFPELEAQLFGGSHVVAGLNFKKYDLSLCQIA